MAITPLPPVPLRSDAPATFVTKADAFLGALNLFATEVDAVGVALTLGATNATSATSLAIGTGSKSLTCETAKSYVQGMTVKIASTASPSNWMLGDIQSYNSTTGALVVNVTDILGTGTFAAWTISQSAVGTVTSAAQQSQLYTAFTTGGTSSAFTLTPVPALTALAANQRFRVKFSLASTGTPTLAVSGLTAASLKQYDSVGIKVAAVVTAGMIADVEYDGTDYVVLGLRSSDEQIQSITASVSANALTVTLNPTLLDFRSPTLASGAVNTVPIPNALSLTVPSGVSLATIPTQSSRFVLLALYNGGNPVLGISNLFGTNLDETTLINSNPIATTCTFTGAIAVTTGILTLTAVGTGTVAIGMSLAGTGIPSGITAPSNVYIKSLLTGTLGAVGSTYQTNTTIAVASTVLTGSAGVGVYSASAVTASPFRVVGFLDSTQAVAGTWAAAPTALQGSGGEALTALSSLGYGQTWQNVTASRVLGTVYYNTTGKPIFVNVNINGSPTAGYVNLYVDGIWLGRNGASAIASGSLFGTVSGVVPNGSSYYANGTGGLDTWAELR